MDPQEILEEVVYLQLLEQVREDTRKLAREQSIDMTTPDGGIWFIRTVLGVKDLAPYQEEIIREFVEFGRIAVRAPHGAGKTAISAWIVLWGICAFPDDVDVKVITTASAWRQLEKFTWPEIRKWASKADFSKIGVEIRRGKELLELMIKVGENKQAFAVASDNPAFLEGAHATIIIYVFDEAKAIPNETWDAAEGAFSTAGSDTESSAFALAISTPGVTSGRFYDISQHKPGYEDWRSRHITLQECINAGRISQEWVDQRIRQWGENSAVFKNRVLGEFDDSGEDNVVPLAWVEEANRRWQNWWDYVESGAAELPEHMPEAYGVDPAYKGEDKTAIAKLQGRVLVWIKEYAKQDTMQTAGRVAALTNKQTPVAIDIIGVGAGVYDRLREQGYSVIGVDVRTRTDMKDKSSKQGFVNLRSAIWWMIREALDPQGDDPLALPPDDGLTGDLTAPTWWYRSDGKIEVESKDEMRERIGRSPDKADALGLALMTRYKYGRPLTIVY